MGSMFIWSHHIEEREGVIEQFSDYFGKYIGFFKLVREVYLEELKDDLSY